METVLIIYIVFCLVRPHHATVRPEDCSFERGICGWRNATPSDSGEQLMSWQVAFDMHRPAELPDKTFGTSGEVTGAEVGPLCVPQPCLRAGGSLVLRSLDEYYLAKRQPRVLKVQAYVFP